MVRDFEAQALADNRWCRRRRGRPAARRLVGCGETLPDQKIAIADPEDLTTCPPGRIGEIWVHGPSVAQGYWRQPEATEATFHAYLKDTGEGPFLRTGDLGFIADGELFVTGRLKDLIIVRGANYYPQDMELTVQQSHPRLRRDCGAAFTAERDGREELVVVQEVERHKKADFGPVFRAIRRAVAGRTRSAPGRHRAGQGGQHPQDLQRQDPASRLPRRLPGRARWTWWADGMRARSLPETREAAEEPPAAARPRRAGQAVDASKNGYRAGGKKGKLTELVLEEIHRVAKERAAGLTLDSPIIETGLDSLERMEILASLEERFGGRFPPEILPQLETARQVIEAVEKHLGVEPRAAAGAARRRDSRRDLPLRTLSRVPRAPPAAWTCWRRRGWAIRSSASTRGSPTTAPSSAAAN